MLKKTITTKIKLLKQQNKYTKNSKQKITTNMKQNNSTKMQF